MSNLYQVTVVIRDQHEFDPEIALAVVTRGRAEAERAVAEVLNRRVIESGRYEYCYCDAAAVAEEAALFAEARRAYAAGDWPATLATVQSMIDAKQSGDDSVFAVWDIREVP